jgi:hypothetical protein
MPVIARLSPVRKSPPVCTDGLLRIHSRPRLRRLVDDEPSAGLGGVGNDPVAALNLMAILAACRWSASASRPASVVGTVSARSISAPVETRVAR